MRWSEMMTAMSGSRPDDVERLDGDEVGQDPVIVLEQVLERDQDIRLVVDDQDRALRWVHLRLGEVMRRSASGS